MRNKEHSRATPSGILRGWECAKACHPSVGPQGLPGGWGLADARWLLDCCPSGPHRNESVFQPPSALQLTWSCDLSASLGSPVCSYAAPEDKSVHCLMGNRPSQHFVLSTTWVRCVWSSWYHQQLMLLGPQIYPSTLLLKWECWGLRTSLDVHRCCWLSVSSIWSR